MKRLILPIIVLIFIAVISPTVLAQSDNSGVEKQYIEFQKRIDDRSGKLTDDDLAKIDNALQIQEENLGLKGFVLIVQKLDEWDFDEYANDQFAYWKSKGIVDAKSYVIFLSVEDQKFQIVRGGYINTREHDYEIMQLRNRMYSDLKSGNIGKAVVSYINGLGETATLKKNIEQDKQKKEKGSWYMLIGILILISVFMRMSYMRRKQYFKLEEKRKREQPFIE